MRKYFLFSIFFSTFVACYSCDYAVLSKVVALDHAAEGDVEVAAQQPDADTLLTLMNDWIDAGAKE